MIADYLLAKPSGSDYDLGKMHNTFVEENSGLQMKSGELAGERYKVKRVVVLTFMTIYIVFFTPQVELVSTLKTFSI